MFRNRTYTASIVSTFLVSFGFFGAIIFLPRWFQFVNGSSATESGYQIFPLLIGLIGSSIVSGILVSRTGRYKPIILTGLVLMTVGIVLMTQLTADTDITTVWLWMFVTGARHRANPVRVHDRRPERRPVPAAGRGDQQPDVLPPDRRLGRPGRHRHDLRLAPHRGAARAS